MKDHQPPPQSDQEPLFHAAPGSDDPADRETHPELFESIVLPEVRDHEDRLIQTMWPEIPADDPSHHQPRAIERWSDDRPPLSPGLRIAMVVGTALVLVLGSVVAWTVLIPRMRRASAPAAAAVATDRPAAPRPARSISPPVSPAVTPPAPVSSAPASAVTSAPTAPPIASQAAPLPTPPRPTAQVAPPPLAGIPMPPESAPRPSIIARPPAATDESTVASRPAATEPAAAVAPPPVTTARPPNAGSSTSASIPTETDEVRLRALMDWYRDAFASLDVEQARAVWPGVETRALARAFGQLSSQRFDFAACEVLVTGDRAAAACSGNAEYVTKVGSRAPRVDAREWQFEFRRVDQQWRIASVVTR